jgi:hypothetical protein
MLLVALKGRDASATADLTANKLEPVFECVANTLELLGAEAHSSKAHETILDLLHKSKKGEAFADKNLDFTDKSRRKCFAPTAKNRLLQEVYQLSRIEGAIARIFACFCMASISDSDHKRVSWQ